MITPQTNNNNNNNNNNTMKAAQGKELGDIDAMLTVEDDVAVPDLMDLPPKKRKTKLIIQTHAVALACGDCRVLSGKTRRFQGPPSFPYIPGGDCSGIVWKLPPEASGDPGYPFRVGDRVAARFAEGPRGALAEYAIVDATVCETIPDNLSFEEGAVLASAAPATLLAERIRPGERVLVMGAGGGVGSHACQIMRNRGASRLVGCALDTDRLLRHPLAYDEAVDYAREDPFANPKFREQPFDVFVDLAGGSWRKLVEDGTTHCAHKHNSIVKPASQGGRYLTLVPDEALFEATSVMEILKPFLLVPLWRAVQSRLWGRRCMPRYSFAHSLDFERTHLTRTMAMAREGTLKAQMDSRGPFPFTTEGVRKAFRLQETRHAKGKVVIQLVQQQKKN